MSEPAQVASRGVHKTKLFTHLKQSFQAPANQPGPTPVPVVPVGATPDPAPTPDPIQNPVPPSTPVVPPEPPVVPPEPVAAPVIQADLPVPPQPIADTVPTIEASVVDTVAPQVIEQEADTLNPPFPVGGGSAKEAKFTVQKPTIDTVPGMQYVEHEDAHELPTEVESFIQKVENHQAQLPHEVVIADQTTPSVTPQYVSQPVIVLPITADIEKEGAKKDPLFSIRWLVEWSHKVMKMFSGRVVYRQEPTQQST